MTYGTSLLLLAVGAILRYAVNDNVKEVDLQAVGLILMIVGVVGLALSLLYLAVGSRDRTVVRERDPRY